MSSQEHNIPVFYDLGYLEEFINQWYTYYYTYLGYTTGERRMASGSVKSVSNLNT